MDPANENNPLASNGKCPICGKPSSLEYKPFCSKRCADVDLNRWLSGTYAIPAVDDPEDRGEDDREDGE